MFHIFSKKHFLVDLLNGFVDIHNHILPGIDDGAKTVEDSISLIKAFSEIGIEKFIATPHIMDNYYPNNFQTINQSLIQVKNELIKEEMTQVSIEAAAEHMIDGNFENILDRSEIMPIQKNYLLVEMSYLQPSLNFDTAIEKIGSARYFPIFAHPERYNYLHNTNKYDKYKQTGILFQLNILSLGGYYGDSVKRCANKLLEEGKIDFLASDVHHLNHLEELKKIQLKQKTIDRLIPIIDKTIYNFS
ncbi:tyrosine-protein phosphatase [Cellulophaga tyrosinoxydans]|uniref:protein-tyrosine-phosphatase n=1 Tax=Cellulophaga tyrosinoxydans TaxID=504486 RepID=A0A1W2A1S4_9FLAO|nr:CpsB/CapC family capsule biosynthesis tyrosine phosphatase [Cellulophaga tyrosinoxydans]SMC54590.1 Tyrosine-protein phosphatase YwqE [Cellulophaga tyrosinoxydans]